MSLLDRVAEAAEAEPGRVRPVLQLLVGEQVELADELRPVAASLNEARRTHVLEEFLGGAIATDEVIELLPSVGTRQGVHRLRKAGRLWGRTVGNATWFPAWQFSASGIRDDLAAVLERITRFTSDVVAADRIMRLPRSELGGRTIAEALDSRRWRSSAWRLLDALGTQLRLPVDRPDGLRMRSMAGHWWRLDAESPVDWSWRPFPSPRFRFDSAGGLVRVRYASSTDVGAARERYRDTGSYIPADHAGHVVVRCTGRIRVLDLRSDAVLDALGLDDRISTGREASVWQLSQSLTDRAVSWWGDRCQGIVYRSRTTPESAANLAFFEWTPLEYSAVVLADAQRLLDELVVAHAFTVGF